MSENKETGFGRVEKRELYRITFIVKEDYLISCKIMVKTTFRNIILFWAGEFILNNSLVLPDQT
jgi:hypothetical protein